MTDDNTETADVRQMNLNGDPADAELSDAEMRSRLREAVNDSDGVFLVTGTLSEDEDGDEGVQMTVARFVDDDVPDDEKAALFAHIAKHALEHAIPGGRAMAVPVGEDGGGGLAELLAAVAGGASPEDDDDDAADDAAAGMFQ